LVLGHGPPQEEMKFLHQVDSSARLAAGDQLVVCGEPRALAPLLEEIAEEVLPHLRWANWLRRTGRMFWRTMTEIDIAVLICTAVLFTVVVGSTVVYLLGVGLPISDAIFRTISVIATGADMHEGELVQPWQKVFVSVLRISGAALIAAFTAIVTNYLLRARLGGALEIRRIPDSGHIVVCGLGNIGFRVVEVLLQYGERVVVIETQRDSKFMAAARRLKVAIIIGDATVLEVLRQAHVLSARAVVAATNNELANLEIALLARELNSRQRVVVRLNDPLLCETLRDEANIRLALSIPNLAAPAFVAALFGDRVLSVFLVKGRLMAAIELQVQGDDPFLAGHSVRALAIDYGLMPVHLRGADHLATVNIMDHHLNSGDRLVTITTLPDLTRFLRRERVPADCMVEVVQVPPLARKDMIQWLNRHKGWNTAEAEKAIDQLPLSLGNNHTRGQAEDLLALFRKQGVQARLQTQI
ncbi:MAG TPA: NAD-binding protein, partial [Gemmataceae bacterium]|nr:NAD-binding protein [Gemmataceae bacterium]